jgi:Cof subfamily protein (haloacid dehalogenase superfamily)
VSVERVRLVATDMDGTLLAPDGTVSPRTAAALRAAGDAGIMVVLVTGRPPRWARGVVDPEIVHGLVICANGAVVYDPVADRIVEHNPLTGEIAARIVRRLREEAPGVVFAVETGTQFHRETAYATMMDKLGEAEPVPDALDMLTEPVTKLLVRHPGHDFEALYELAVKVAGEDAVATHSGFPMVEISAAGVTKAFALERLCGELGIAAGQVVGFGDQTNDLPMLAWTGHSVATANAHPDVLAAVDEVTASNADDGVARVLERMVEPGRMG